MVSVILAADLHLTPLARWVERVVGGEKIVHWHRFGVGVGLDDGVVGGALVAAVELPHAQADADEDE